MKMISFCFLEHLAHLTDEELSRKIEKLNNLIQSTSRKSKKYRDLNLLTEIIHRSSTSQLQSQDLYILLNCSIKILVKYSNVHFESEVKIHEKDCCRYQLASDDYKKLVQIFAARDQKRTFEIIIDVIYDENLWIFKRICVDLFTELYGLGIDDESQIVHILCDQIENIDSYRRKTDIKLIAKVLYEVLNAHKWPEVDETIVFLERLLNLYYRSLSDARSPDETNCIANLRSCLELCCKYTIRNISNNHRLVVIQHMSSWSVKTDINDDFILNYGSTLEYAALMHESTSLCNSFTSELLSLIMQMIGSNVRCVSLLGNRVFQYLIDRKKNQFVFNKPKIFFQATQVNLKSIDGQEGDMKFLQTHRQIIHENLIKSFVNHKITRLNLETTYCTVCLLATAVPCGFTVAALSCLMMNLQDVVMKEHDKIDRSSYHIHAIIISVMSFICWLHEAKDFHAYIYGIIMERAQWAPHLNPPLQSTYNFAVHHVLWHKSELFLVDWEVRFGLWKRFRLLGETPREKRKKSGMLRKSN